MRRCMVHDATSTSTTSLLLLHATNRCVPSADGCAHVGEQLTSAGLGGSAPCPPMSCAPCSVEERRDGAPGTPCSLPFVSRKGRAPANDRVWISMAMSSIMHPEYCFVPCGFTREPWGIVHVGMRAT